MEIDAKTKNNVLLIAGVIGAVVGVAQLAKRGGGGGMSNVPIPSDPAAVMSAERDLDRKAIIDAANINASVTELDFDFGSSIADRIANSAYETNSNIPVTAVMFANMGSGQQTQAVQQTQSSGGTNFGSAGNIPFGSIGPVPINANMIGGAIDGVVGLFKGLFGGGGGPKPFKPDVKIINALAAANQNVTNSVRATDSQRISLAEQNRALKFKGNQAALMQVLGAFAGTVPNAPVAGGSV
jgi:hypothetical protein